MKRLLGISIISLMSLIMLSGCGGQTDTNVAQLDSTSNTISVNEVLQKLNDPSIKIIDVRTQNEYSDEHISSALLIPVDIIAAEIGKYSDIEKNSEILVYCRSGNRSMQALKILNSLGYTNVKSMNGGILAWDSEGYKVCKEKDKTC
ncbi:rhodanese-like domain-containing protein [Candidatus Peregrinibacteria bacterium]|nr:rhodanese-like domain-containing protein [Candidatus Peregrinibacteria bacterium]